jgi:hypothetical protein
VKGEGEGEHRIAQLEASAVVLLDHECDAPVALELVAEELSDDERGHHALGLVRQVGERRRERALHQRERHRVDHPRHPHDSAPSLRDGAQHVHGAEREGARRAEPSEVDAPP